jgi:hypothetical protein
VLDVVHLLAPQGAVGLSQGGGSERRVADRAGDLPHDAADLGVVEAHAALVQVFVVGVGFGHHAGLALAGKGNHAAPCLLDRDPLRAPPLVSEAAHEEVTFTRRRRHWYWPA